MATIIACLVATTVFASCEKRPDVGNKPRGGENVEFTILNNRAGNKGNGNN